VSSKKGGCARFHNLDRWEKAGGILQKIFREGEGEKRSNLPRIRTKMGKQRGRIKR